MFNEHLYAFHQFLTRAGEPILNRDQFMREWSVDEIYDMIINDSDTDMIVAQPLPLTDLFHDGLSSWEKCAQMAKRHPDRAVFWGTVNPLEGKRALDLMTRQVEARDSNSIMCGTIMAAPSPGAWTTRALPSRSSNMPSSSGLI
jgi:uncharacterized protein